MENPYQIYLLLDNDGKKIMWSVYSPSEKISIIKQTVESHIQKNIERLDYTRIERVPLYINHPEWGEVAREIEEWNSNVWKKCYQILEECLSGIREIPTPDEIIVELPKLNV